MNLTVRGLFRGPSGYDHHVREFVREFVRQGVDVELVDVPEWSPARLADDQRDPWFESLIRPLPSRTMLHFCMPHQVVPDPSRHNVNYTMFEATRITRAWVTAAREHDLIVVPTQSSFDAWVRSGVPRKKMRLSPLGVNTATFTGTLPPLDLPVLQYKTRFLNISELGPRKNLLGLLRTWIRATSFRDDAVLIVKLGIYAPGWHELFQQQLTSLERELEKGLPDAAPVLFLHEIYSDDEMPRLYSTATHYLSLSFGEGWDQPMAEAASSGLQLIAPKHSAYTHYLDETVATWIPSRETPAEYWGDPATAALFAGASWWAPDEEHALATIRGIIDGSIVAKASARERMMREHTWERAAASLIGILSDLETNGPPRSLFSRLLSSIRGPQARSH